MLTAVEARKIVTRGERLLDRVKPGWFRKVKLREFDLGSESHCVLGYVYKDFFVGLAALAADATKRGVRFKDNGSLFVNPGEEIDAVHYGFNTKAGDNADFETLGQRWVRVIQRRKAAVRRGKK